MNELSIFKKYPVDQYNLLGNTDVMVEIPDIKSPVVQVVRLNTNPSKGDVYIQQKAKEAYTDKKGNYHPSSPDFYAITKNGLKKLADGAGIKMMSSEHVIPTTCQKCVAVNQHSGKVIQCGNCRNRDVAYRVTISVPQLTGEILTVEDTHEIIVENAVIGMSDRQRTEFLRHLPQICEAKALNGAIRTALHIKGTYLLEEIQKPFVVAYLVPNLNHDDVKEAAIRHMFRSSTDLFGKVPDIRQIESRVPEDYAAEASDGEEYDQYVDGTYMETDDQDNQEVPGRDRETEQSAQDFADNGVRQQDFYCDKCGEPIARKVWNYSMEKFDRPLCYTCQRVVRNGQGGGMRYADYQGQYR